MTTDPNTHHDTTSEDGSRGGPLTDRSGAPTDREGDPPRPWFDIDDFVATHRLTRLVLAPDDAWLLATVSAPDEDGTGYVDQLWRIPTDGSAPARRLTRGKTATSAQAILRDGLVVFTAKRDLPAGTDDDSEDDDALWCLPAGGGESFVLARRRGGFGSVLAARDADVLACSLTVQRGVESLADDAARRAQRKKSKVQAILHEGYPVRFWDHDLGPETARWAVLDTTADPAAAAPLSVRLATRDEGPGLSDSGVVSPDGAFVVTDRRVAEPRGFQRTTLVRVDLGSGEVTTLADEPGVEWSGAVLSDDGRWVATTREPVATPETVFDQVLHLVDARTGAERAIAPSWDRWASPVAFSPQGDVLWVTADEDGAAAIFAIDLAGGVDADPAGDRVRRVTDHGAFSSVRLSRDGATLFALRTSYVDPGTPVRIDAATGAVTELASPLSHPQLPGRLERVETTASDGVRVPGWLCLPEGADAAHPAPLALWVHGGPLSSWNAWSWRWNPWLLVSRGYAVLLPDPALSTGYGLDYIQRAWGRWGAESFTDIMALTEATAERPDVDGEDAVMMGGSYGGYMANWIAGHTGDRFKAIVSHASLWNLDAFSATTDAAWYWNVEMSPAMRHEYNPRRFVDQITAPMLVIHGDRDYRVPIGEGLALWWELNQHHDGDPAELPHRFLYFPDENHWVLTPQHAKLWYQTVIEFLAARREGRDFRAPELL